MIVALLSLSFSLSQVVMVKADIPAHWRFGLGLTWAIISAIPVVVQLFILIGELWRAGPYFLKLFLHKLIQNLLGDYGAGTPLLLKHLQLPQSRTLKTREPPRFFWNFVRLVPYVITWPIPSSWLTFGDAFSGEYQLKNQSVALWMTDDTISWKEWYGQKEPEEEDLWTDGFEGSKQIRDVIVIWGYPFLPESLPREESANANRGIGDSEGAGDRASRHDVEAVTSPASLPPGNGASANRGSWYSEGTGDRASRRDIEAVTSPASLPSENSASANRGSRDSEGTGDRPSRHHIEAATSPASLQAEHGASANRGSTQDSASLDGVGFVRVRPQGGGLLAKLYFDLFTNQEVSKERYVEFCKLMKAINNDTFFVSLDKDEEKKVIEGQEYLTLRCLDIEDIMTSLLRGKKVRGKKLRHVSYI